MSLPICSSLVDEFFLRLHANGYQPTSQLPMVLLPDGASEASAVVAQAMTIINQLNKGNGNK